MHFHRFSIFSALVFFLVICFVTSCEKDKPDPTPPPPPVVTTESYDFSQSRYNIPETEKLFEYVYNNISSAKGVMLIIQGGPITQLSTKVKAAPNTLPSNQLSYYMNLFKNDYTVVTVQQINTYYPDFDKWIGEKTISTNMPLGVADTISLLNVEIIKRVAKHFHDQNKEVYLYGASYGSLLINLFIERYPNGFKSFITKTAAFVGRLKPRDEVRSSLSTDFAATIYPTWKDKGTTYQEERLSMDEQAGQFGFLSRIIGPILGKDYIATLASKLETVDKKNIWYCTSEYDNIIGRMRSEEVSFAKKYFTYSLIKEAPHGAFTLREVMQATYDYFKDGTLPNEELTVEIP